MVQVLIILAFFAARLQEVFPSTTGESGTGVARLGHEQPDAVHPWWGSVLPFLSLLVMWTAFHVFTLRAGASIDRTGRLAPLNRAHALMTTLRISVLIVLFASVLWPSIAWADRVRAVVGDVVLFDELVIASPVLLMLILTWWSVEPLERRVHDALFLRHADAGLTLHPPQSRASWVWTQVRHQMLLVLIPICSVLAWGETTELLPRWFHSGEDAWWVEGLHWAGILVVLLLTPLFLRLVWSTVPLGDGELRDQILRTCRAYRIRVVGPLVWRTHGTLINAAILGMFFPFRYLLLSDALLERLPREQLEVVLAHEVAHVRKRHMLWTGAAVFATILATGYGTEVAIQLVPIPELIAHLASIGGAITSVFLGFLVFGFVSRRFEWDADAFAVAHMSRSAPDASAPARITPTAVDAAVATLQSVADLNAIPVAKFSYRHGSIAQRQKRVAQLLGAPVDHLPIARQVLFLKAAAATLLVLAMIPIATSFLWDVLQGGGAP